MALNTSHALFCLPLAAALGTGITRGNESEQFRYNFVLVRDAEPSGLRRCANARRCFWNWLLMREGLSHAETKKP